MLKFYRQFILSLVITLAIAVMISSGILFMTGNLYGQNKILKTKVDNGEEILEASTYILEHYTNMERNGCFNKRVANDTIN